MTPKAATNYRIESFLPAHGGLTTPCWIWLGACIKGHGRVQHDGKMEYAHRVFWEREHGPIPPGRVLHHICEIRPCVNPGHTTPKTRGANVLIGRGVSARNARKTHCPRGHEYTSGNTWRNSQGHRFCRQCNRDNSTARRALGLRREYDARRAVA